MFPVKDVTQIYSASSYEIVGLFHPANVQLHNAHDWAWMGAIESTLACLSCQTLRLASAPTDDKGATGGYGELIRALQGTQFFSFHEPDPARKTKETEQTRKWFMENPDALAGAYRNLAGEPRFRRWLDAAQEYGWEEPMQRKGALFDRDFVPVFAALRTETLAGLDERGLNELSDETKEWEQVRRLRSRGGRQLIRLSTLYVLSAIVRGRFHESLAVGSVPHLMQHMIRRSDEVGLPVDPTKRVDFPVGPTSACLAALICAAAFEAGQTSQARIDKWSELIEAARRNLAPMTLKDRAALLREREPEDWDAAARIASRAAKTLELRTRSSATHKVVEVLVTAGIGLLLTLAKNPWVGVAGGVAWEARGLSRRLAYRALEPESRFLTRAQMPGRLQRGWQEAHPESRKS